MFSHTRLILRMLRPEASGDCELSTGVVGAVEFHHLVEGPLENTDTQINYQSL